MQTPPASPSAPAATGDDTTVAPWLAVLSVGIGAFALVTSEFLPVGLLPAMAAELAISKGQAGLMITTPGIVAAFAAIFVTVGSGRLDRRIVLLALTALLVASNLLVALAPSYGWILLGRALLGVGVGGFWAIGSAIGPRLVAPQHASRAMSIIFAGVSLGTVAGVPAGALLGELASTLNPARTKGEHELLVAYRRLNTKQQGALLEVARSMRPKASRKDNP